MTSKTICWSASAGRRAIQLLVTHLARVLVLLHLLLSLLNLVPREYLVNGDDHLAVVDLGERVLLELAEKVGLVLEVAGAEGRALEGEALVQDGSEVSLVKDGSGQEGEIDNGAIAVERLDVLVEVVLADEVDDEVDTGVVLLDDLSEVLRAVVDGLEALVALRNLVVQELDLLVGSAGRVDLGGIADIDWSS